MESKAGFIKVHPQAVETKAGNAPARMAEWTDWRGPNRDAVSSYVPEKLPAKPTFLWKRPLRGIGLSGIAATGKYVIVSDKSKDNKLDIFHCLDAETGEEAWAIEYPAEGDMDFSNSPRANPVISDGLVYLLGAFGDSHCVELDSGKIVWKKNI